MAYNIDVTLRLNNKDISPTGVPLILTKREINKLSKGNSHNINFNRSRLERMKENGRFIQALLPFLPAILFRLRLGYYWNCKRHQSYGNNQEMRRVNCRSKYSYRFPSC